MNPQIENFMKVFGLTEEEATEMFVDDCRIDKGEKLFELSPEQEQASKQARRADRKPNSAPAKREKKIDNDKLHLMKLIETAIGYNPKTANFEFVNPERECLFIYNEKKYKITLSCPRS